MHNIEPRVDRVLHPIPIVVASSCTPADAETDKRAHALQMRKAYGHVQGEGHSLPTRMLADHARLTIDDSSHGYTKVSTALDLVRDLSQALLMSYASASVLR